MSDHSSDTSRSTEDASHGAADPCPSSEAGCRSPSGRDAVLREILDLMDRWKLAPGELIDPAERQAALGNARRLVDFWRITPDELAGPLSPTPAPQPIYRYTHPQTGETWDGRGPQPAWLRRCLINEGYRLDDVRAPFRTAESAD